jgi:uncharacterized Zn finger protein
MQTMALTEEQLIQLAGARSYTRGQGYLDAVTRLRADGDGTVTALVSGTDVYEVTLWLGGEDGPDGECDCPYGQEGNFCKHCVAVGLTLLAGTQPATLLAQRTPAPLDEWLATRTREELAELIRERLAQDAEWRRALELRAAIDTAARNGSGEGNPEGTPSGIRTRILELVDAKQFSRYGYIEYAEAHAFGKRIAEAAAALSALTAAGRADRAVVLAREAIETALRNYESVDDSDGWVGDAINGLAAAHLKACRAARPDPEQTARWLVEQMLHDDYGTPEWQLQDYGEVLGTAGLTEVRRLAQQAYADKPTGWAEKQLMESLHQAADDVDALVELYAADLAPRGGTHLRIALTLDDAGRTAEALEWAERGLRAAADERYVHDELVDYVTRRYADDGRHDDALAVRRDRFRTDLTLSAYRKLRTAARTAQCWDGEAGERSAALDTLRTAARKHPHATTRGSHGTGYTVHIPHGGTVLIDVLIDEGELDEAWQTAEGLASPTQWLALADASVHTRPADAARVYQREVDARKHITGDGNYLEITKLLIKARSCHERLGSQTVFAQYVSDLRTEQKRKRNLMKILDQHHL